MGGENQKTMFPLSHPLPFTPSPHLPFFPQESVYSSLLRSYSPPPPPLFSPPPLSIWMALYHNASLSPSLPLSLSACVQSCGRSETCIVENACV